MIRPRFAPRRGSVPCGVPNDAVLCGEIRRVKADDGVQVQPKFTSEVFVEVVELQLGRALRPTPPARWALLPRLLCSPASRARARVPSDRRGEKSTTFETAVESYLATALLRWTVL